MPLISRINVKRPTRPRDIHRTASVALRCVAWLGLGSGLAAQPMEGLGSTARSRWPIGLVGAGFDSVHARGPGAWGCFSFVVDPGRKSPTISNATKLPGLCSAGSVGHSCSGSKRVSWANRIRHVMNRNSLGGFQNGDDEPPQLQGPSSTNSHGTRKTRNRQACPA
jgi:hypothetical protein